MKLNLYDKIVLTVIALCLIVIALRPLAIPQAATAFSGIYPESNINIQQIGGQDIGPGGAIPVVIVK